METKNIYKIDLVLIVGSIICLVVLFGYVTPLVISPLDNLETTNTEVLFSIDKATTILIDDNLGFSSPERINVENNALISLKPGQYYWKALGVLESDVRNLTIISKVDLRLESKGNELYDVVNAGNVPLKVEVYNKTELKESFTLDIKENLTEEGDKFIGGMEK